MCSHFIIIIIINIICVTAAFSIVSRTQLWLGLTQNINTHHITHPDTNRENERETKEEERERDSLGAASAGQPMQFAQDDILNWASSLGHPQANLQSTQMSADKNDRRTEKTNSSPKISPRRSEPLTSITSILPTGGAPSTFDYGFSLQLNVNFVVRRSFTRTDSSQENETTKTSLRREDSLEAESNGAAAMALPLP